MGGVGRGGERREGDVGGEEGKGKQVIGAEGDLHGATRRETPT